MNKIKSFDEYINENNLGLLAVAFGQAELDARKAEATRKAEIDAANATNAAIDGNTSDSSNSTVSGYSDVKFNPVAGNDDFAIYMQHQQGTAGAAGLIKALNGTGKMASDTIKTKGGVKYANLVKNIPSDRPQVKANIIKALDNGDQKGAAALFLNVWKEKWFSRQKQALVNIEKPIHAKVKEAIKKYSTKYSVPFDFAVTVAMIESGLNPRAGNSTYKGLYALQPNNNYGGKTIATGSNWSDPNKNAQAGIKLLASQVKDFKRALGNDWASLNVGAWTNSVLA
jgi:hypothetical protein